MKMGWEHYQTVEPLKREPQVGRGLFGARLLFFLSANTGENPDKRILTAQLLQVHHFLK